MLLRGEEHPCSREGGSTVLRCFVLQEGFASVAFMRIKNPTAPATVGYQNATLTEVFAPFQFYQFRTRSTWN